IARRANSRQARSSAGVSGSLMAFLFPGRRERDRGEEELPLELDDGRPHRRRFGGPGHLDDELPVPGRSEDRLFESGGGADGEEADRPPRPDPIESDEQPLLRQGPSAPCRTDLLDDKAESPLVADEESPGRSRRPGGS